MQRRQEPDMLVTEYEVSPRSLRFTQLDIAAHFKKPYQDTKIEEAVTMILHQVKAPSDFGKLRVVRYDGEFWSLDNRRLWVFRKARVKKVTVCESEYHATIRRFQDILHDPQLMNKLRSENFLPRIRRSWLRATFFRVHQVANVHLWNPAAGISVVAAGSSHVKNYHPENPSLLHEGATSSIVNGYFPKQDQASHHVIQIPSDMPDPLTAKLLPASTKDQDWYSASQGKKKQQQEPPASLETYTEGFFGNCSKYPWQTFLGLFSRLYSG